MKGGNLGQRTCDGKRLLCTKIEIGNSSFEVNSIASFTRPFRDTGGSGK